jgi:hypothetical protein
MTPPTLINNLADSVPKLLFIIVKTTFLGVWLGAC